MKLSHWLAIAGLALAGATAQADPAASTAAVAEPVVVAKTVATAATVATPATTAVAPVAVSAAAPAEAAPAAVTYAQKMDKGDTAWMLVSTVLVIFMTLPGLALFYGGMARSKNMLSILMQCLTIFSIIAVLWVVYGYSFAFTEGNAFFGGASKMFMEGVGPGSLAATFSHEQYIPELVFAIFQLTFAAITCALIAGGYAERMKFSAVLIFTVLWFTISYIPMAHMVWYWDGPDAYTSAAQALLDEKNGHAGFLWQKGALDFAGGTVVHINAGVAGLMCALFLGKRKGYGKVAMPPHSLTMTMIGASMLFVGWFGFNAGSNLEANGYAGLAAFNTLFGTAVAALVWTAAEWIHRGKPSLLGSISGAIAGLVAITPACGFIGPKGALITCAVAALLCFVFVTIVKNKLGYDDALDAFGVHAVGGIVGAICTGIFVSEAWGGVGVYNNWHEMLAADKDGKPFYDFTFQVTAQVWGVMVAVVWSAVSSAIILTVLKYTIGLRVSEEVEEEGLDQAEHGEKAYNH
jgi:Amt family ammonium transporter